MQKKKRKYRRNRMAILGITAIVICIIGVCLAGIIDSKAVLADKVREEQELKEQLASEKKRTKELEDQKSYVQTKEYIEEKARSFGYIYKDEELLIPDNSDD